MALAAGMRYLAYPFWQLLDFDVLRHRLLAALWHLHGQPPLYNAMVGVAEKVGGAHAEQVLLGVQLILGLAAGICVYLTLIDLEVNPTFSLLVSLVLLLNPAAIEFEFDPLYTELVYALLCFFALSLVHYLRGRSSRSLWWLMGLMLCLTLVRASYQWVWLVAVLAVLLWHFPANRRQLRNIGLAGLLLSLLWPAKNFVLFHHFASTTWAPYSLGRHWGQSDERARIEEWVNEGAIPTFAAPGGPEINEQNWLRDRWAAPKTGAPELDDIAKRDGGGTNWNSLAMLRMLDARSKDVSFLFRHDPKAYVKADVHAVFFYFNPSTVFLMESGASDQSLANYEHIAPVERVVRRVCCSVLGLPPDPRKVNANSNAKAIVQSLCVGALLVFGLMLVCVLSVFRRSLWLGHEDRKVFVLVATGTVLYVFLVGNLMEVGENMRFRFETHALAVMVCAIFVQQLWDGRRRGQREIGAESARS
jgi:hypothetical protein